MDSQTHPSYFVLGDGTVVEHWEGAYHAAQEVEFEEGQEQDAMGILGQQPTPLRVQQQQQAATSTRSQPTTQASTIPSASAPATPSPAVLTTSTVLHHRATYTIIPLPSANSDGVVVTLDASFSHDTQPVSILVELAKHWHEHETGQPYSVTKVHQAFDRLPANYRVYTKDRDDGSGRVDRYIVGHPCSVLGRRHYYRSASSFAKHLINLMADNDMDECDCDVCSCECKKCT